MAERRMFAKSIVLSDDFLDMPMSARNLYFTFGMLADDDGFINNPRSVMRQIGATNDDLRILLAKSYVILFDSGVIVIRHWRIHNYIQKDRYKPSKCVEKGQISVTESGMYTKCIQPVSKLDTQVRLEEELEEELRQGSTPINASDESFMGGRTGARARFTPPTVDDVNAYCRERGIEIDAQRFVDFYASKGWRVGSSPMKDWKAAVRNWAARDRSEGKQKQSAALNYQQHTYTEADFGADFFYDPTKDADNISQFKVDTG